MQAGRFNKYISHTIMKSHHPVTPCFRGTGNPELLLSDTRIAQVSNAVEYSLERSEENRKGTPQGALFYTNRSLESTQGLFFCYSSGGQWLNVQVWKYVHIFVYYCPQPNAT